jgi:hypothetical protein
MPAAGLGAAADGLGAALAPAYVAFRTAALGKPWAAISIKQVKGCPVATLCKVALAWTAANNNIPEYHGHVDYAVDAAL